MRFNKRKRVGSASARKRRSREGFFWLEPWAEMVGTPMGSEFLEAYELIDPKVEALYRKVV